MTEQQEIVGYRMSQQQHACWLSALRSVAAVFIVDGVDDSLDLRKSLEKVVARHEILRTTFCRPFGRRHAIQVIHDHQPILWLEESSRATRKSDRAIPSFDDLDIDLKGLDPQEGPTLKVRVLELGAGHFEIALTALDVCADHASLWQVVREWATELTNQAPGTPPLQYADYAAWQQVADDHQPEEIAALDRLRSLWQRSQANLHVVGDNEPGRPSIQEAPLSERVVQLLRTLGCDWAVPVEVITLSVWLLLLSRLTDESTVGCRLAFSGRTLSELESAVGPYSKTVPFVASLDRTATFVQQTRALANTYRDMQLGHELILRQAAVDAWQQSCAAFGFEYHVAPRLDAAPPVRFQVNSLSRQLANRGVVLRLAESERGINLEVTSDGSVLKGTSAKRLLSYFVRLLESLLSDVERMWSQTELLDQTERSLLIEEFNTAPALFPLCSAYELFEQQARRHPEREAIRCGEAAWTYRQLAAKAGEVSTRLAAAGVVPGQRVAILLDRQPLLFGSLLGALKSGVAYVPLAIDHPSARLAMQIREAQVVGVITLREFSHLLSETDVPRLCLDDPLPSNVPGPKDTPVSDDSEAYALFTSGSTGAPKAVAVTNRNLVNYTLAISQLLEGCDGGVPLHFATVSTIAADLGNTAIFPAWFFGGCVHAIPHEMAIDAVAFAGYCAQHPIDVLKITPTHLEGLLLHSEGSRVLPRHYLFVGGERLTWHLVDRISELSNCRIINHYGPTETTVGATVFPIFDAEPFHRECGSVPIGRSLANMRSYVVDSQLQLVPQGIVGELCLAGSGVARGYVNRPAETAERFVADPFSSKRSDRMYRTGDLVRQLEDGTLEFLGRRDQQVKISGFRIEPGEIAEVLRDDSRIANAVVGGVADGRGNLQLAAYVVPLKDVVLSKDELYVSLRQRLPEYMIPTHVKFVSDIPVTDNGKVAWQAIHSVKSLADDHPACFSSSLQQEIATVFEHVLGSAVRHEDDDFFSLGGHSLPAMEVVAEIRDRTGVELPLRAIFDHPSVAGLARMVEELRKSL